MLRNLGLDPGLYKQSELTGAYHQKCKELHPDVLGNEYDEAKYLELKPSLEYLINHGYYKIDQSWDRVPEALLYCCMLCVILDFIVRYYEYGLL